VDGDLPWPSSLKVSSRFSLSFSFFPRRRFLPPWLLLSACDQRRLWRLRKAHRVLLGEGALTFPLFLGILTVSPGCLLCGSVGVSWGSGVGCGFADCEVDFFILCPSAVLAGRFHLVRHGARPSEHRLCSRLRLIHDHFIILQR
jgi:hypothetical protein